jgi:hypothetical protein
MASSIGLERTLRLLTRTPNPAAIGVLGVGLRSAEPEVRAASARAMATRRGNDSAEALLRALPELASDVHQAIIAPEFTRRMRPAVLGAIKGEDVTLCKRACRYADEAQDHQLLPAMVAAASKPDHPYGVGLATTALRLAHDLAGLIHTPATDDDPRPDPAFARRAALNALTRAIDSFREHRHVELVEAMLLLASPDDLVLTRILQDPTHPAHGPLCGSLASSPSLGAMRVVMHAILSDRAPKRLVEVLIARCDQTFVEFLLTHLGERPPLRAMEHVRSLPGFAWAQESSEEMLLQLSGQQQATALRLAAATSMSKRRLTDLVQRILEEGQPAGRVAACEVVARVQSRVSAELLKRALSDDHPAVVGAAAAELRRRGLQGSPQALIELLNDRDAATQADAKGSREGTKSGEAIATRAKVTKNQSGIALDVDGVSLERGAPIDVASSLIESLQQEFRP